MADSDFPSLEERVRQLEERVAQLEARPAPQPYVRTTSLPRTPSRALKAVQDAFAAAVGSGEGLLGKAGIALLVVGLVLLFRYAVMRGWITPELRIAIGLVVGAGLLAGGFFYFAGRRLYRRTLMAGGIIVLFITGLAASGLYQLVGSATALAYFAAVALAAFLISAHEKDPLIATLTALSALLAPSALLANRTPGASLWLYLLAIIVWTGLLLATRGWEQALLVAAIAAVASLFHRAPGGPAQVAAAGAMAALWFCFAALPLVRARLLGAGVKPLTSQALLILPAVVTIGTCIISDQFVFRDVDSFWMAALSAAAGYAIIASWLSRTRAAEPAGTPVRLFGEVHSVNSFNAAVVACGFSLALAALFGFGDVWTEVSLGALAAASMWMSRVLQVSLLRVLSHGVNLLLAFAFLVFVPTIANNEAFDSTALGFATAAGFAALVALRLPRFEERAAYWAAVYIIVHVLLATELTAVPSAPWLASAAYGIAGGALLVGGLLKGMPLVRYAGLLSLALLVARMFIYDLANVELGVRIVLFIAFGFVFLGLSWFVRSRFAH